MCPFPLATWKVLSAALLLVACGGGAVAPITDHSSQARPNAEDLREVVRGDTLYSIAWEAGRDYREIARWNDIDPPYLIVPGQRIRLAPPGDAQRSDAQRDEPNGVWIVQRGDTLYRISKQSRISARAIARANRLRPPYVIRPGQRLILPGPAATNIARGETSSTPPTAKRRAAAASKSADPGVPVRNWRWPVRGELIARFEPQGTNKGLDIAGRRGQPIEASAEGTVVYEGSGLRGYGRLIIIKHNADYLSAYAHCDKIYVREGNVIKGGQKIADMGNTGTDRVKLHFEIRRRGVPVDPLEYLPKI